MKPFSKVIHIYNKIFLCRRQRKKPILFRSFKQSKQYINMTWWALCVRRRIFHLPVKTSGIPYGVFSCLSLRVFVHSLGMLSRWVCMPLPDPPQVWHFFSPHPLPHLPCRLTHVLLYLSLIFDLILPHFQRLRPWATAYLIVVHFCILALEAFNSQCILFLWMPSPTMFLQIFSNSSHWNASAFCISLFFAIILSSSTR